MTDDGVTLKSEAPVDQEKVNRQNTVSSNGEDAAENQTLSKRQRKKLMKQQKWEEERELRK